MLYKILYFLFSVKVATCSCKPEMKKDGFEKAKKQYEIRQVGKLPETINESSGLARSKDKELFWTHNDGGGKNELYLIDYQGVIKNILPIDNAKNIDWEDLAQDTKGNIFIGDFGNNNNDRQDLTIYKTNGKRTSKITFSYANQEVFPPKEQERNFDCEAFFWYKNHLYLFSKNRGNHSVKLYSLPDTEGNYELSPIDSIFIKSQVTAADISPDEKTFALLTYGKILFFDVQNEKIDFSHPKYCLKMARTQTEALIFLNNSDLLITNEQGKMYLVTKENH